MIRTAAIAPNVVPPNASVWALTFGRRLSHIKDPWEIRSDGQRRDADDEHDGDVKVWHCVAEHLNNTAPEATFETSCGRCAG